MIGKVYVGDVLMCPFCGKPYAMPGLLWGSCTCGGLRAVTTTTTTDGTLWIQGAPPAGDTVSVPSVFGTVEPDDFEWSLVDLAALRADLPAMKARADAVKDRPVSKDVDGLTARELAMDVLTLIEALEQAG